MRYTRPRPRNQTRRPVATARLPHPSWLPDYDSAKSAPGLSADEFWDRLGD
jgi:hypothetical protein